jgi:hypothetical protein
MSENLPSARCAVPEHGRSLGPNRLFFAFEVSEDVQDVLGKCPRVISNDRASGGSEDVVSKGGEN